MSQETYNYWSLIPSLAGSIISLGVGIVVFCYTKETQQLCRLSAEQLAISRPSGGAVRGADCSVHQAVCDVRGRIKNHPIQAATGFRSTLKNPTERVRTISACWSTSIRAATTGPRIRP